MAIENTQKEKRFGCKNIMVKGATLLPFFILLLKILNGYAIMYWDAKVEENNGLVNPDLLRFP